MPMQKVAPRPMPTWMTAPRAYADVDGDAAADAGVGGSAVDDTDSDTGAEGVADAEAVGVDDCVVGAGVEGAGLVGDVEGTGVGLAADGDGDGAGELVGDATEVGRAEGDPEDAADVTGTEG